MLGAIAFLVVAFVLDNYLFMIGTGVLYLFQLIEGLCAKSFKYFGSIESVENTFQMINRMRMNRPVVVLHIQNYHYETRTRRVAHSVSDGRGGTKTEYRTETYTVRVNTHYAS